MKKIHYIKVLPLLFALLIFSSNTYAQRAFERIHKFKVHFIADRIDLTDAQAKDFWPIYDNYESDQLDIRKEFFKDFRKRNIDRTEEQVKKYLDENLDYQEAIINLKRKYNDRFLKVISAKQLADLYAAEREFKQMLIQKLRERRSRF